MTHSPQQWYGHTLTRILGPGPDGSEVYRWQITCGDTEPAWHTDECARLDGQAYRNVAAARRQVSAVSPMRRWRFHRVACSLCGELDVAHMPEVADQIGRAHRGHTSNLHIITVTPSR